MSQKDQIYRDGSLQADDFVFNDRVVRVFPDMIRRSVPGYGLIVPSIALLARRYAQPGTKIYDLGSSLGAVTLAIADAVAEPGVEIVAVDNSPDMVARFREIITERGTLAEDGPGIQVIEGDVLDTRYENASVVVLNFTLQFIDREVRADLLQNIANGMRPGGILVLSEKIRFESEAEQQLQNAWHHDFKRAQGYSDLEIARKRDALEQTLRPDSMDKHIERLLAAGFSQAYRWFQCFNFASVVAVR